MQQRLEEYLSQVESELRTVPATQRDDELREMRQHLIDNVTVNQEILGYDEEQAVATAIEEFGAPQKLAAEVLTVWQRGERRINLRSLVGATLCSTVCFCVASAFVNSVESATAPIVSGMLKQMMFVAWGMLSLAFAGSVTGLLFPRRAIYGTWLALSTIYFVYLCEASVGHPASLAMNLYSISVCTALCGSWTAWWTRLAMRWNHNRERKQTVA